MEGTKAIIALIERLKNGSHANDCLQRNAASANYCSDQEAHSDNGKLSGHGLN
jgi:hypothetical protein